MKPASLIDRLLSWRIIDESTGCWLPKRCWSYNKHFAITYEGRRQGLHRLSAIQFLNLDPNSALQANHKSICPHKACFNPEHIYVGTQTENMKDYKATNVQSQKLLDYYGPIENRICPKCKNKMTDDNVYDYISRSGKRYRWCKFCRSQSRKFHYFRSGK